MLSLLVAYLWFALRCSMNMEFMAVSGLTVTGRTRLLSSSGAANLESQVVRGANHHHHRAASHPRQVKKAYNQQLHYLLRQALLF